MFTGLVETTGEVFKIQDLKDGKNLSIHILFKDNDVCKGDSISINGVCLSVTSIEKDIYTFYCSYKTLELTNLGYLSENCLINVERSLTLQQRVGGHLVTGHIDDKIKIVSLVEKERTFLYKMKIDISFSKYIVKKGSVALDGISLTVVDIKEELLEILLIPETIGKTNVQDSWKIGKWVNLEIDIIGRYIEKFFLHSTNNKLLK